MRFNQGNIVVVICAPSGANWLFCRTQAVVTNHFQFSRGANFAAGLPRPQSSSCWPHTSTHTKHALPKRAQPKPTPSLRRADRSHRLCATDRSRFLNQLAHRALFSESNAFAAEADTGTGATDIDLEEQAGGTSCRIPGCVLKARYACALHHRLCG